MRAQLRAAAALALFLVLGNVLFVTSGGYDRALLLELAVVWAAALGFIFNEVKDADLQFSVWLAAAGLVWFSFELAFDPGLDYFDGRASRLAVSALLWTVAAGALCVAWMARFPEGKLSRRGLSPLFWTLAAILLVCRALTVACTPRQPIDVYTIATAAADQLLQGHNPYSQTYERYRGAFGPPVYAYWPGALFPSVAARALLGDIRYAFVLADAACAGLFFWLARRDRLLSRILPLLWLAFPVSLHVLDFSWVDTLLTAWALLTVAAGLRRNWLLAGLALGCFCATKQYSVFFAVLTLAAVFRSAGARAAITLSASATLVFALLVGPFVALDARWFWRSTVTELLRLAPRYDSLSIPSALVDLFNWETPPRWLRIVDLVALGAGLLLILRSTPSAVWQRWAAGVVLVYGALFLFGTQAHCNYYALLASFVLLRVALSVSAIEEG
jgi:hypothetical protein